MGFKDFTEFGAGPLELPYHGKTYTIPEVSIELGARLTVELSDPESDFNALPIEEMWRALLGDAFEQMREDKVPVRFVSRCFITALTDFQFGREAAEAAWESGLDPKALEAYLTTIRAAEAPLASTSTDEASTTP